jgi:hypothetical protein
MNFVTLSWLSNLIPAALWSVMSGIVLTAGDINLRTWLQYKWPYGFELTILIYVLGLLCMVMSFFQQHIAVATIAAIVMNAAIYIAVASYIFHDSMSGMQIAGIVLGLAAFAVLELA